MAILASDYVKSKYLRAVDLKGEIKLRIKAVTEEVFEKDGRPDRKPVLSFTTDDRGLVLNITNIRTLSGAFGDPFAGWINKVIIVYPTMEPFRGKMTACLRVRIPTPKPAAVAPQQPATSGNGAAAALPAAVPVAAAAAPQVAVADPELEPDPVKLIREDLDDDISDFR